MHHFGAPLHALHSSLISHFVDKLREGSVSLEITMRYIAYSALR